MPAGAVHLAHGQSVDAALCRHGHVRPLRPAAHSGAVQAGWQAVCDHDAAIIFSACFLLDFAAFILYYEQTTFGVEQG